MVDVYHMIGGDEDIVVVVEEANGSRTINFVHLSDEDSPLCLRLQFDLPQYHNLEESDDDLNSDGVLAA